jgi:hypothetical protein
MNRPTCFAYATRHCPLSSAVLTFGIANCVIHERLKRETSRHCFIAFINVGLTLRRHSPKNPTTNLTRR